MVKSANIEFKYNGWIFVKRRCFEITAEERGVGMLFFFTENGKRHYLKSCYDPYLEYSNFRSSYIYKLKIHNRTYYVGRKELYKAFGFMTTSEAAKQLIKKMGY